MKNKTNVIIILLAILTISLTGCSKYEKDESYTTDLYGIYSDYIEAINIDYSRNQSYTLNADNTYNYIYKEINDGITSNDFNIDGKILSIEEISNDITQITLDYEITDWSTGETSNKVIYKYKNMLGFFIETDIPDGKTFELHLDNDIWYDENGQYHICTGIDNCDCSNLYPQYIRKGDIIYFQSMDEEHKNCYTIANYIVKDGLFSPECFKE